MSETEITPLDQQTALVTGASSGIGEATAKTLASEGVRVAITARRTERLTAIADDIADAGGEALTITADITDEHQVRDLVQTVEDEWDRLDILVNSAGVMLLGPIDGADTDDWRTMVNVNLLGSMYAVHAALPVLTQQGGGHIVNISSTGGRETNPGAGVYAATKHGLGAFSEILRKEVAEQDIRVTVIEPGPTDTELSTHITDEQAKERVSDWLEAITPLESDDIASAIRYAVSQPPRVDVSELMVRPTDSRPG